MKRKLKDLVINNIFETQCVVSNKANVLFAAQLLKECKSEAAIILKDGIISGIVTEKDIFNCFTDNDLLKIHMMTVDEIMSKKVICVDLSYTLEECLYIMCKLKIHHLPIVDLENKKPFSIISLKQIANVIMDEKQFEINQLLKYITGNEEKAEVFTGLREHKEIVFV